MTSQPLRLLIHGASGRMGRALLRLAALDPRFLVVAAVSRSGVAADGASGPFLAASALSQSPVFDVAIDFSLPGAIDPLVALCSARGAGLVSGTTGLSDAQVRGLEVAARQIPVLSASNFSLGVAVLEDLVRRASGALRRWDVAIVETHHVHKLDAPSGTALSLARASQEAGHATPQIESLRQGEVVGDHVVRFCGPGEVLELTHRAGDRDIFAMGALEAAQLLAGRSPGSYRLGDLLFSDD